MDTRLIVRDVRRVDRPPRAYRAAPRVEDDFEILRRGNGEEFLLLLDALRVDGERRRELMDAFVSVEPTAMGELTTTITRRITLEIRCGSQWLGFLCGFMLYDRFSGRRGEALDILLKEANIFIKEYNRTILPEVLQMETERLRQEQEAETERVQRAVDERVERALQEVRAEAAQQRLADQAEMERARQENLERLRLAREGTEQLLPQQEPTVGHEDVNGGKLARIGRALVNFSSACGEVWSLVLHKMVGGVEPPQANDR
jgi:hypothetical protein